MKGWHLFRVLALDFYRKHPIRGLIGLAGIAVGTAVATSINMTGAAAVDSFSESLESVTGSANIQVYAPTGIEPSELDNLWWIWQSGSFSPFIQLSGSINRQPVTLYGFDLAGDDRVRTFQSDISDGTRGFSGGILVPEDSPFGTKGDTLSIVINAKLYQFPVLGVISNINGFLPPRQSVLTDLSVLYPVTNKFSGIDFQVSADSLNATKARLETLFPAVRVQTISERKTSTADLFSAFRMNLQALGLIALLVAAWLVYNTLYLGIIQRRQTLHLLLTMGAKDSDLILAVLAEGFAFGLLGGLAGSGLGIFLSGLTGQEVTSTLNAVFQLTGSGRSGFQGLAVGGTLLLTIFFSVIAAVYPAWMAGQTPAAMGLKRGKSEYSSTLITRLTWAAGIFLLLTTLLLFAAHEFRSPVLGYAVVISGVLTLSLLAVPLLAGLTAIINRISDSAPVQLASASVREHIVKVGIATAALTITLSMAGSVVIMVHSFKVTVTDWLNRTIVADVYFRSGSDPTILAGTLPAEVIKRLETAPETRAVITLRNTQIILDGRPVEIGGNETSRYLQADPVDLIEGNADSLMQRLSRNWVIASEGFAFHHRKGAGDTVVIADRPFSIAGVYRNYSSDRGFLLMNLVEFQNLFGKTDPTAAAVFLKEGESPETALLSFRQLLSDYEIDITPNSEIRKQAIDIFDQTFRLTQFLQVISIAMAFLAVITTLLAMIWDRKKDWAMLLAFGSSPLRLLVALSMESLFMIGSALGLASLGSWFLSGVLISVINKFSFGWSIFTAYPWSDLAGIGLMMLIATLLSAALPGQIIRKLNLPEALKPTVS